MERQRSCTRRKFNNRLLILVLCTLSFISTSIFSQNYDSLQFNQENDFAMMEESVFTISLVDVSPSDIELRMKALPLGVEFISSEKSDGFIRQSGGSTKKGTTITYIVRFFDSGTYNLGSLPVIIEGKSEDITFPIVQVLPNPDALLPELYIEQSEPLYSLHKSSFTIFAKYFKRVEDISIGLSEQALIEKTSESFEIPSSDFSFSDETINLATFSCIPFESGTLILPEIRVTFIAHNGQSYDIILESTSVSVLSQEDYSPMVYGEERKMVFAAIENDGQAIPHELSVIEKKEAFVKDLAALRISEKYSFFPFSIRAQRKNLEKSENIENDDEVSFTWTVFSLVVSMILIFGGLILNFIQKQRETPRHAYGVLAIVLGAFLLLGAGFYGRTLLKDYALTFGTELHTIPEYESHIVTTLYAGTRVEILRSVGDWYLISQVDGRTGWILKEDCILITK